MLSSLRKRASTLAAAPQQLAVLQGAPFASGELPFFDEKMKAVGCAVLRPVPLEVLQVNVGYRCNQVCAHCHVDAAPDRKEVMQRGTFEHILEVLRRHRSINTLDITGGAPEMNPHFRWLVEEASAIGVADIIVRSNLTILVSNAAYRELPEFFAKHCVHVVSSLPFYKAERTDRQRGEGVFEQSLEALRLLNDCGYGKENSGLLLDLVYNPAGAFLPAAQQILERDFKRELATQYGIAFNRLFALTNLPISRFLDYLLQSGNYEDYMHTLVHAFNAAALNNVMCRNTVSVAWDGTLYDCDFNQILQLPVAAAVRHIADFDAERLQQRAIVVSQHCYGCTAGAGSSCQGSLV